MNRFIERLEKLLDNSNIKRTQIVVSTEDMYLIHIYGYEEHAFSIKIATFPENMICFFGYNKEIALPLNDEGFDCIVNLINKAINFGTRVVKIHNKKKVSIYEFISDGALTSYSVLNLYKTECERSGKKSCSCTLICSDFCGNNIFEVEVT